MITVITRKVSILKVGGVIYKSKYYDITVYGKLSYIFFIKPITFMYRLMAK